MLKKLMTAGGVAALLLAAGLPLRAQSSYSNAVMSLNPAGYWPLNETTQPPQPINLTASNLSSLGAAGNGYYGAWYQPNGTTWYLTNNIAQSQAYTYPFDGSMAMQCQGQAGQYVIVPRNTNGVNNPGITINPPFSIEAWVKVGTTNSALGCIVSQGGSVALNTGGPNTNNPFYGGLRSGWAGVELGQYQDYFFLLCQNTNTVGTKSSELDTSPYATGKGFKIGAWVYLVATFDNAGHTAIWTNGVICTNKTLGKNVAGQTYVIDPTSPLMIGGGSDVTASYGQGFIGTIHDVAIYNVALQQTDIQNHWQTANGTNATYGTNYPSAVLANNPVLYYRLNDPQTKTNAGYPSNTFPVANNYGSLGASGNGVYQPGTTPGVAGPPYAGFGSQSTAVAFNGWLGGVDIGGGAIPGALNPTNTAPLTVVAWFQGGPADSPGRFQEILGHGNNSYRLALGQIAGENHFNPGPGPELQFASPADMVTNGFALNDGGWHMVAGVSDGTNEYMYLDGILAKSSNNVAGINITGSTNDLLIGGDSQFTTASFNASNTVRTFDGQVAQVAFWTNALSMSNIQQLYSAADVPPYIVFQPNNTTNNQGQAVTVSATIRGSNPLNYQWYKNGSAVGGQTTSTLTYNPALASESGNYYLIATNAYGSVTSSTINLTIYGPPTVQQQTTSDAEVFAGTSPTLHAMVAGAPPIYYQWTLNGNAISGATNSSYQVVNAQANGTYNCTLSNFVGTASLTPISLTILPDPTAPFPAKVLADGA
ncbi:MAG TPA: LamG-like jellyroll fold domain-containing protein, partial [Verrucomicrobiae bacterium]|nr:LamG-like jellyroll fold domain-containing protein [Verrucomicrobiae bacterium]